MSEPQSESKSEATKETSQNPSWIERLNLKTLLLIGVLSILFIPMIILAAKGDNQLCILSTCYGTSGSFNLINEAIPLAAAGGTIFLVTSIVGLPLLPAFGVGAIVFLLAHQISFS